jgi:DNA-binding protein YbaB
VSEHDETDEPGGPDEDDGGEVEVVSGGNPLEALFGGGGELPDLGSLFDGLAAAQAITAAAYEGSAGGGLVRIRASGRMDVESVTIDPGVLDDDGAVDLDLVADLVRAALADLTHQIAAAQSEAMGPLGGLLGE